MSNQMIYRANRDSSDPNQSPTDLERYAERHIVQLFRGHMGMPNPKMPGSVIPNHDFGPIIETAAILSEKIDWFDNNQGLLDQVIFGIVYPDLCHPGIKDVTQDRELVALLLIRNFKRYGGLCLPPLQVGRILSQDHEIKVRADLAAGRTPAQIRYPNWRQTEDASTPRSSSRGGRGAGAGRGGGNAGRGESSRGGSGGN